MSWTKGIALLADAWGGHASRTRISSGVQSGLFTECARLQIYSLREYRAALGRVKGSNRVLFLVCRGDDVVYIAMKPG